VSQQLKSFKDLAGIWRSGQLASQLHEELRNQIKPGRTTAELDAVARGFIDRHDAVAAFLGYRGFPAAICVSVNDEIVHGIPGPRMLDEGDLVSIDLGVVLDGYVSDTAFTWLVGAGGAIDLSQTTDGDLARLCQGTSGSLTAGIAAFQGGERLRKISLAIQGVLLEHGLGIVRELTGHGVGFALHEEPTVYNFDCGQRGPVLTNGLVLALEPMATAGSDSILLAADHWTYKTADGSAAAHYEHTVTLWDDQVFVLTDHYNEEARGVFGKAGASNA
jgi:methionyl aminopeptidase